jgi:diguanylate cyclase (GGDEF)-like protein
MVFVRSSARPRSWTRLARVAQGVAVGLMVAGVVVGAPLLSTLAGAAATGLAAAVLRAEQVHDAAAEREVRRWWLRALVALTAGLLLEAGLIVLPGRSEAGLTLGALLLAALVYQGLVRWNRHRTALSDPGDWLNGLGATLCATALGALVVQLVPGPAQVTSGEVVGHLLRLSALLVLLGTSVTIAAIAGLRRDPRSALVVTGIAVAVVVETLDLVRLLVAGAHDERGAAAALTAWTLLALAVARASGRGGAPRPAGYASSRATTMGAVVVIGSSVVVLTADALTPRGSPLVAVLAATGAVAAGSRVLRLVDDLSALASSRIEARTDALTGVANRRALTEAVDTFSFRDRGAALLVVDLDRFKEINDRFGHQVGDEVIRVLARRLHEMLPDDALLARLGGDEFAVVLEDPDPGRAQAIGARICTVVAGPVEVDGRVIRVAASVGVASTVLGEQRDGELLRCADAAMYLAKRAGGGVQVYDQETDERGRERRELVAELRAMLEHGRDDVGSLVLHYQPQVDAVSGALAGVEALVRWDHPRRGLLPPVAFLDLAEEHGLMTPLTWEVLDQATRQAALWRDRGTEVRMAVNLSASCLEYPGLLAALEDALRRADLPARCLAVEITETSLMADPGIAIDVTRRISALGVTVSIDDYGTGYSSLAYLDDLPADELKLDGSFTVKLARDDRTRAIVSGTIELAHRLGIRVVAEGVEDERTLAVLVALGCDLSQGYLHARPAPADELEAWFTVTRPARSR